MTPNSYSDYGPAWCESIIDQLNGVAFEVGIESDKKQRGSAVLSRFKSPAACNLLIVREPGMITIGCQHQTVAWWESHYRNFIALAKYWMKLNGVLEVSK